MPRLSREAAIAVALAVVCVGFTLTSPYFATAGNLLAVARRCIDLALVALGEMLVLAAGGIDVSAGVAMGVAALAVGHGLRATVTAVIAALAGPAVGLALGGVAALAVVAGQMPPIVATLGLWGVWRAALYLLLGGHWMSGLPRTLDPLLDGRALGIPPMLGVIATLYGLVWLVLRRTPAGPRLLAVGGREDVARRAGIGVARTKALVYVIAGALNGVAATAYVAQYRNVEMTTGGTLALDAIVAAVLGGCAVEGGEASVLGTALGVVLLRVIQNGMVLMGLPSLWTGVVEGTLLIMVLAIEAAGTLHRRGRRAA